MTVASTSTVRVVQDVSAPVDVQFLVDMADRLGWVCVCRGRGEIEGRGGVNDPCPVCGGSGVAA